MGSLIGDRVTPALGVLTMLIVLLVAACAAPQPSGTSPDSSLARPRRQPAVLGGGSAGYEETQRADTAAVSQDKTLIIGIAAEVRAFSELHGEQNKYVEDLIHGNLFLQDEGGRWFPGLAAEMPSGEAGTLRLIQDGTLEAVYRIRRGVKWHDGVEFTVHDLVFAWNVGRDKDLPFRNRERWERIAQMEPLDNYTLKTTWGVVDAEAGVIDHRMMWPKPRHILEEVYKRDKQELLAHPFWSSEFVGLGPYKLVKFEHGSHLELTANDDYVLGKPKIRKIIVRFYQDSNVLIAALLAGEVHMTLHGSVAEGGLSMSEGILLGTQWSGTREGKVLFNPYRIQMVAFQLNREFQRPGALADVRVRQALLHAMDRQTLVDQLFGRFTDVAHGWLPPDDPDYASFADAVTRYDYDPARAQRLLAEAGWRPGPDGVLVNPRGERFKLEYRAEGREAESVATIVADYWKQVGIDTELLFIARARARDHEWMAKFPGVRNHYMVSQPVGGGVHRYTCTRVPGPENNWLGQTSNPGGYCSQEMERHWKNLIEEAFPFEARMGPFKEMMRVALKDLPYLPLYFESEAVAIRSDVVGINRVPPKNRGRIGMHAHTWAMQ